MMLAVERLGFAYNGKPVLEDVSFRCQPGTMTALLGVNGAGKSTLLKCLNRVLSPQQGTVFFGQQDLARLSRSQLARKMGYVPQGSDQLALNVFDAALLGRKPHTGWAPGPRDHQVVSRVLARLGLEDLALRPVDQLSGGERQKVMLARALAQEPQVLLLDEPTSNLDLRNQVEVMGMIHALVSEQGLAAVVSVHDLNLALRFADRFLLLHQGRIRQVAAPDELNAELIEEVFGVKVAMARLEGQPVVIPLEHGPSSSQKGLS
jgi:iron complex transport system ATP-binding protein